MPRQNAWAAFQSALILVFFGWVVYMVGREHLPGMFLLPLAGLQSGIQKVGTSMLQLLWEMSGIFAVFGIVDLVRQKNRLRKDLSMSKQEIQEEAKESEGNPQVRARIRRIQRDMRRRRMMSEVPTATAVIVNPTHFAVAIRYKHDSMAAPVVVAKGKNYLALRIRQKALENQIPLIENPPLAQALYKSVDVGREIPPQLYRAVAEILAYVHRLSGGRLTR
jgi:flagellar biosynthetic protein FlhB